MYDHQNEIYNSSLILNFLTPRQTLSSKKEWTNP